MRELTQDPFYKLISQDYDRCVIDYCLVAPDAPYRGIRSHREAVLFAMLKMIERYLMDQRTSEERWRPEEVAEDFFPWSLDFGNGPTTSMPATSGGARHVGAHTIGTWTGLRSCSLRQRIDLQRNGCELGSAH